MGIGMAELNGAARRRARPGPCPRSTAAVPPSRHLAALRARC